MPPLAGTFLALLCGLGIGIQLAEAAANVQEVFPSSILFSS